LFPAALHQQEKLYSNDIDIHFFLLIPCLNEEKVIAKTIHNLLSLNMPNTTLVAINDGSTDNTLEILNSIQSEHLLVINRVLPDAQQGKGKALNNAYSHIRNTIQGWNIELSKANQGINAAVTNIVKIADERGVDHSKVVIGVLDADTFMKRSLLERVALIMSNDPKAGLVQTRVRIGTSTRDFFLPLMQDIEFFSFVNRIQNVREYMGTVAAAGNGQFNRLSAMEQLGEEPWSQCLLEDFDFSLRLLLKGWRTRLLQDEMVYQQGVIGYRNFVKQRTRWAQGDMQCMAHLPNIFKSKYLSLWGKVEVFYFIMLPWFTLLSTVVMILSWFLILYTYWFKTDTLHTILNTYLSGELFAFMAILFFIIYLPGVIFSILYWRDTKESLFRCLLAGLFIPVYNTLQLPAVVFATVRQTLGNKGWVKTDRV
jgi:cellulose synthase/poly-beta-1,6-N-acetylglucosamine synthase-like glycosyltransferase